jgi:hypothetical protein
VNTRKDFEEWFMRNYKWFIEKDQEGYSLECYEMHPKQYINDIPHHDWRVWQAAVESIKQIGENK